MATPTTPWNITLFDDTTMFSPIQGLLNAHANDLNTAMNTFAAVRNIATYKWANSAALTAQVGMTEGDIGDQADTNTQYRYSGTAWVLNGGAIPSGIARRTTTALTIGNATYADMTANAAWSTGGAGGGELNGGMTYSGGFIVPTAGLYSVEWSMLIAGTAGALMGIGVNISGTPGGQQLHALNPLSNTGATAGSGSAIVRLAANDKLTLWGYGSGQAVNAIANQAPHWGVAWIAA
jgi:hypothetical protein